MARGGGTGSRTKTKKKSETTTQNGADTELKQNKTTKHRKQKVGHIVFLLLCVVVAIF